MSASDVVAGDIEVATLSRRNLNLQISLRACSGFLLKQADPLRAGGARTLANELAFYAACARDPSAAELLTLVPRVRILRRDPPLLAVEWCSGACSPWIEARRFPPDRLPTGPSAELGAALAVLHDTFVGRFDDSSSDLGRFPRRPSDFLSVHRPEPRELRRISGAQLELLRLIQGEPSVGRELDRARAEWRCETLLHGDVRAANLLVLPEDTEGPRLRLIDWELAKWGDPAWDLGCALADLIHFWVRGMPRESGLTPSRRVAEAQFPLASIQRSCRALWDSYRSRRRSGEDRPGRDPLLVRAVRCSGGRLIQAAWQRGARSAALGVPERGLLQVAANALADPVAAVRRLYGLEGIEEPRA